MLEQIYSTCMGKKAVTEGFPFGEDVLVFKVAGKMFALVALNELSLRINLKCDPKLAIELREQYESVLPGYHMNKQQWNTLVLGGELSMPLVMELIDQSYDLILASLTRKKRAEFDLGE